MGTKRKTKMEEKQGKGEIIKTTTKEEKQGKGVRKEKQRKGVRIEKQGKGVRKEKQRKGVRKEKQGKGVTRRTTKTEEKHGKEVARKKTIKEEKQEKGEKKEQRSRQTTARGNLTCLKDAVTFTKFLKDNVVNFLRRNTRLTAQNSLTNKKATKKGEYKEPAARLIQAGLGDKSNLSCSGSTTSIGAKKMKTVTDILDGCEMGIKKAC